MKQKSLLILIVAIALAMILPLATSMPSEAASLNADYDYSVYIVQPGDTLASIARKFCTSWQIIYDLNYNTIGPDPDHVVAGMALTVPNGCYGGGGCGNVYDRGWLPHAQGNVIPPDHYWVIRGDTWYSIGKRFGVSVQNLRGANGLFYPYAYTSVIIPCLNANPTPPVQPQAAITITSPPANATLAATFTVSGTGGNLPEANVVVRVKDQNGAIIAEEATVLQGPDVGLGGEGTWSVQFTVNEPAGSQGTIEASSPGTSAFASITVIFGNNGHVDYPPGQCQIRVRANEPGYDQPNGQTLGIFTVAVTLEAEHRERVNNVDWYQASVTIDGAPTPVWTPANSLDSISAGC